MEIPLPQPIVPDIYSYNFDKNLYRISEITKSPIVYNISDLIGAEQIQFGSAGISQFSDLISFHIDKDSIFIGKEVGNLKTTGSNNIFIGYQIGVPNTTGYSNVYIGRRAGSKNTTGLNNVFIGTNTGYSNTIGYYNTFVGVEAGYYNTEGKNNVFIGICAGYSNTTANNNVFIGTNVGYNNTTGGWNTIMGINAGKNNIAGNSNVFLGSYAGYYETGSNRLFIDNATRTNEATARTKALIYGIFDSEPLNQILALHGNVVIGIDGASTTTATAGFLYIPTCAGVPTGIPISYTGKVASIFDTTNNKLYIYDGGWISVALV